MIDGLLNYVRGWFNTFPISKEPELSNSLQRKRRLSDHSHLFKPKHRKVLSQITVNGDSFSLMDSLEKRSPQAMSTARKNRDVLNFDEKLKPPTFRLNTTPSLFQSPDCYITGELYKKPNEKQDSNRFRKSLSTEMKHDVNLKHYTPPSSVKKTLRSNGLNSSSLDYSIQLDDHQKYKELLHSLSLNSSSIYKTASPFHLQNYDVSNICNRSKEMVNRARLSKSPNNNIVDLTNSDDSYRKKRLSTKDLLKVIIDSDSSNEDAPIEIPDSDSSDVEILPTPPSPKPDIKVDRVNSLKLVIDANQTTKEKWLQQKNDDHIRFIAKKKQEVESIASSSTALSKINQELVIKRLERRVQRSLALKSIILPETELGEELPDLTVQQLQMVKNSMVGDPCEVLVKKFRLHVNRQDIQTLDRLNWLNDNVINFYMNLIIERGKQGGEWPKAYAMNTFFYHKLVSSGPESLRRWTRQIDLFEYEYICVPIHLGIHWCMAIINLKEESIQYFDSMGEPNHRCLDSLRNYLEYEHMDKKNLSYCTDGFTLTNMRNIPQQMNGSDCGVFACTFAEFSTRRAPYSFTQKDMPYLRKKMVVEILTEQLLIQ